MTVSSFQIACRRPSPMLAPTERSRRPQMDPISQIGSGSPRYDPPGAGQDGLPVAGAGLDRLEQVAPVKAQLAEALPRSLVLTGQRAEKPVAEQMDRQAVP